MTYRCARWEDRVLTEGIGAGTANKNISHIGGMIRAVNKRLKLGLDDVFAATRIQGGREDNARRLPSNSSATSFLRLANSTS